jgi:NADPH-dependent 2,4-dienoyl-CoA reductase/sulfur reductase-like enzyme
MRENFKGGKAIFTQPPPPIKCGGGPQKIVYLCNDYWKKNKINAEVNFFSTAPAIFGVKYFSDALQKYADETGVKTHLNSQLISVDKKSATFKNTKTGETFTESYDFLHVVPHMQVPDFLVGSKISNAGGYVDINADMNHKIYKNVWAIGDCISLPNAKTAASVFSQVPVVAENLLRLKHKNLSGNINYDGYASCPLYLEEGKLMLAEFKDYLDENGEKQQEVDESFLPGYQTIPRKEFYNIGLNFTRIYKFALGGRWYGKDAIFSPADNIGNKNNFRKYYKYFSLMPYQMLPAGFGGLLLLFAILH